MQVDPDRRWVIVNKLEAEEAKITERPIGHSVFKAKSKPERSEFDKLLGIAKAVKARTGTQAMKAMKSMMAMKVLKIRMRVQRIQRNKKGGSSPSK